MDQVPKPALLARFRATLGQRLQRIADSFDEATWAEPERAGRDQALAELHTLKGEARLLGLLKLASLAHELESAVAGPSFGVGPSRVLAAMRLEFEESVEPTAVNAARHDGGEGREQVQALLAEWARHAQALAAESGKLLRVVVRVEEGVEYVEELLPALLHFLRNAVDHGLELPHERGDKPREGRLTLSAEARASSFVFTVEDDGRGIAPEVIELLFEPGFSTCTEVTALSGRGLGLDAARRQVQALGGRIAVETELGEGSRFVISVPRRPGAG